MRHRRLALTGPAAAALYQLDGFRDYEWPHSWCVPWGSNTNPGDRTVQARKWEVSELIGDIPVCSIKLVARHLHAFPTDLQSHADGIAPMDRVELAVEHILRLGHTFRAAPGGSMSGDVLLRAVLRRRGKNLPTESYAETRAVQRFREWDIQPWRQIPIIENGRTKFRADFMIPFRRRLRPDIVRPSDGLLIEIDSREFHENQFDRDHERGSTFDALGFHWISVTPNQIEYQPTKVFKALDGASRRAHPPT
jgi:very-short-patch-repair endonuclease